MIFANPESEIESQTTITRAPRNRATPVDPARAFEAHSSLLLSEREVMMDELPAFEIPSYLPSTCTETTLVVVESDDEAPLKVTVRGATER